MEITSKFYLSQQGNALASGCEGCDGDGIYATITKVLFNVKWYDEADEIIMESLDGHTAGETADIVMYAVFGEKQKQIENSEFTFSVDPATGGCTVTDAGVVTFKTGTTTITAVAKEKATLSTSQVVTVA